MVDTMVPCKLSWANRSEPLQEIESYINVEVKSRQEIRMSRNMQWSIKKKEKMHQYRTIIEAASFACQWISNL